MGKSTAILIASATLGALVSMVLGVNPGFGAGYCAGLAMFGISIWVFVLRPGYQWAKDSMKFSPLMAALVGPLVFLAGAFVLMSAATMLMVQVL